MERAMAEAPGCRSGFESFAEKQTVSSLSIEDPNPNSQGPSNGFMSTIASGSSSERGQPMLAGTCNAGSAPASTAPDEGVWRGRLFSVLVMAMVAVNFDSGGTAASLQYLEKGCPGPEQHLGYPCLNSSDQGILGALPYVGLCVGCPFAGRWLQLYSERVVISTTLALNALATMAFGFVLGRTELLASKFLIGLSHSAICVYVPVWVDAFAPEERKATWVGIVQGCGALGAMFGYAVTAYLAASGLFFQNAFRMQAVWIMLCAAILAAVPSHMINVSDQTHRLAAVVRTDVLSFSGARSSMSLGHGLGLEPTRAGGSFSEAFDARELVTSERSSRSLSRQLLSLSLNGLFMACCLGLSCLFFVMTAVQFWASKFFVEVFLRSPVEVATVFIAVAGSAPVAGVLLGGAVVDCVAGDEPKALARTVLLWSVIAVTAGVGCAAMPTAEAWIGVCFWLEVSLVWLLLFFGAMMLPPVMRLLFHAIPEEGMKAMANAVNTLLSNVLGYALGCALPGQVSMWLVEHNLTDGPAALHVSMQMVFLSGSFCGMICMVTALLLVSRRVPQPTPESAPH